MDLLARVLPFSVLTTFFPWCVGFCFRVLWPRPYTVRSVRQIFFLFLGIPVSDSVIDLSGSAFQIGAFLTIPVTVLCAVLVPARHYVFTIGFLSMLSWFLAFRLVGLTDKPRN